MLDGIVASKTRGLARLLPALAIFSVGEEMAERAGGRTSQTSISSSLPKPEEIAEVDGLGPERVKYVRAFFDSETGKKLIAELKERSA